MPSRDSRFFSTFLRCVGTPTQSFCSQPSAFRPRFSSGYSSESATTAHSVSASTLTTEAEGQSFGLRSFSFSQPSAFRPATCSLPCCATTSMTDDASESTKAATPNPCAAGSAVTARASAAAFPPTMHGLRQPPPSLSLGSLVQVKEGAGVRDDQLHEDWRFAFIAQSMSSSCCCSAVANRRSARSSRRAALTASFPSRNQPAFTTRSRPSASSSGSSKVSVLMGERCPMFPGASTCCALPQSRRVENGARFEGAQRRGRHMSGLAIAEASGTFRR